MPINAEDSCLSSQVVGNVGLYYCCYRLSLLGWNVMPTARNARGIDIIAYNHDASNFVGIQVKTLSKRNHVPLGNSLEKIMGHFWVVINNVIYEDKIAAFILLPEEVKALALKREKDGDVSYWLKLVAYDKDDFRDKWERIKCGI